MIYKKSDLRRVSRIVALIFCILIVTVGILVFSLTNNIQKSRILFVNGLCTLVVGSLCYFVRIESSQPNVLTQVSWAGNMGVGALWIFLGILEEYQSYQPFLLTHYASVGLLGATMVETKYNRMFLLLSVLLDLIALLFASSTMSFVVLEIIILASISVNIGHDLRLIKKVIK